MNPRLLVATLALCAAASTWLVAQPPAPAPGAGKGGGKGKGGPPSVSPLTVYHVPTGPAPKMTSGKPDLNGVWQRPYVPDVTRDAGANQKGSGPLPYTEWGKQQFDTYNAENGDYTGACLPFGHSRGMNSPDPIQFMVTDKYFAFLYEQNSWFKVIPIGKEHDPDKVATWFGDSVAHWDGDTLVIDTINFNGYTRLDTNGHPQSDQLHLIEKLTRTDAGHIAYEMTVDDPKTYTKPWTNVRIFTLRTDWEIQEYSCEENNKGLVEGRIKVPNYDGPKK
ncbi:MAG: hypothetical protein ABI824_01235 [Acidobacteriota bacterium]